ncbi:MAG TPA: hypothetical protein VFZ25_21930 [Chloroflexota bacterium]|nr:hypothetical protein [Chloroflexota bacterium]
MASQSRISHYDFHGIFRLTVQADTAKASRHFQEEYGHFATDYLESPDLLVSVGASAFKSPRSGAPAREDAGWESEDRWLRARERHKVATWRFDLHGLDQPTTRLRFQGGLFSLDYLQHYVEQIVRFKISQRGFLLVHAGCVAGNGAAVLFPGRGHAGKTALALQQVLAGRQFQSDDYTFLSTTGETYAYPRRLHISEHIDAVCPTALRQVGLQHKLAIKAKYLIYYLTLKYGDLSESLRLAELIPSAVVTNAARLRTVLFLSGVNGGELHGPRPLDHEELVDQILEVNRYEATRFQRLLLHAQPNACLERPEAWFSREREVLTRALRDIPGYAVDVPRQSAHPEATLEQLGRIVDQVLE